jgi:hypothetical protein
MILNQQHGLQINFYGKYNIIKIIFIVYLYIMFKPSKDEIFASRSEFTKRANLIASNFLFPEHNGLVENKLTYFGSFSQKIQPYFGDIDTINNVKINLKYKDAVDVATELFRNKVEKLNEHAGWFITDIKCGKYDDGEPIKWTVEEVIKGKRNSKPDSAGHPSNKITLKKAIDTIGVGRVLTKIDVSIPYGTKYIECTVVYLIKCEDGYINYSPKNYTIDHIIKALSEDAKKNFEKNKLFKAIKRIYAQVRYLKDYDTAYELYPLLTSNVSLLSSIVSDLSLLWLLIDENKKVNKNFTNSELGFISEKLENVINIPIDDDFVNNKINILMECLHLDRKEEFLKICTELMNYLSNIVNKYTLKYIADNHLESIIKKYSNINLN